MPAQGGNLSRKGVILASGRSFLQCRMTNFGGSDWCCEEWRKSTSVAKACAPQHLPRWRLHRRLREPKQRPLDLVRKTDDESLAVGHAYLGQRFGVHRVVLADQLVLREDKGGERIDFVVGQRARLLPRHRPPNEVEDGGGIAPEVGDRLRRIDAARERSAADQRGKRPALAVLAVAQGALLREDARALRGRAAADRQARAVGLDADVPGGDVGRLERNPEIRPCGEGCVRTETERENDGGKSMRRHVSPPLCRRSPSS